MSAYALLHHLTGTSHAYWPVLHRLAEWGHHPRGWRAWWIRAEARNNPRNLARFALWCLRHVH